MPKYILLANFTDQGIRNIRGTIGRAEAFQAMAEKSGIVMKELCWTLGRYDVVAVFEAADDESAAALALSASSLGNTRCETLRAFFLRRDEAHARQDGLRAAMRLPADLEAVTVAR
jgi:uncharacterized protein with GYD domain